MSDLETYRSNALTWLMKFDFAVFYQVTNLSF